MKIPYVKTGQHGPQDAPRGWYAYLDADAERGLKTAAEAVDARTEKAAVLALATEMIRLGSDIVETVLGMPTEDLEAMVDALCKLADRKAAREIDAGACQTSFDHRRAREAGDDLATARDAALARLRQLARQAERGEELALRVRQLNAIIGAPR